MSRILFCLTSALFVTFSGCGDDRGTPAASAASSSVSAIDRESEGSARPNRLSSGLAIRHPSDRAAVDAQPTECSRFVDVAEALGLSHTYQNGAAGEALMVETTGGGCGWIDYDRDGRWDLYLNQAGDAVVDSLSARPSDQLFRNVEPGRFEAVTLGAGIDERNFSQGVAIGDFDNDGFDDIYVTNVGGNVLYRNSGDGTFRDVTGSAGVAGGLWSTSAAWADLDLDGDLDLYVCNYVDYDPRNPPLCRNSRGRPATCHPNQMEAVPDECYLNLGDGTFRPVASERGLFGPGNKALGVAVADFNNDGWPDVFVANDTTANFLFVNDGEAHFQELAVRYGCAVNTNGSPQANMGIAVGDYDRNGWLDLFVTHFTNEWNTLYRNRGPEGFQDVSALVGLVPRNLDKLGFGTVMADFNCDGFDELFVGNGHVNDNRDLGDDFEMISQLFAWQGTRFKDCTAEAGEFFERKLLVRGVASADFDDDGDLDLAVVPQNAPFALLAGQERRGNWLRVEFVGRRCNRRGIGARVWARFGGQNILQELAGGTSYCASHQPALFFGLGEWSEGVDLEVRWPGGAVQTLRGVLPNQRLLLLEPLPTE
jgi:hypothetical protein